MGWLQAAAMSMRQGPLTSTIGASGAATISTRPAGVTASVRPAGNAGDTVADMPSAPVAMVVVVPGSSASV
jgi:hypothetical protein